MYLQICDSISMSMESLYGVGKALVTILQASKREMGRFSALFVPKRLCPIVTADTSPGGWGFFLNCFFFGGGLDITMQKGQDKRETEQKMLGKIDGREKQRPRYLRL